VRRDRGGRGRTRGRRRRGGYGYREEARDDFANLADRKVDELSRLFTGAVRASLESLRVAAESTSYFVQDTLERSIPEPDEDPVDVAQRLPMDKTEGIVRGLDRSFDIPGRAIERFRAVYTEEEGGRRSRRLGRRRRSHRGSRGVRGSAPRGEDYERWSRDELYDRAAELGIDDFRDMSRDELADELRREQPRYEDWSDSELYIRAGDVGIQGRADLSRDRLIAELRRRESHARPTRPEIEERTIQSGDEYDRLSRSEIEQRAEDIGVEDPASHSREELVEAIRNHRPPLEDMSKADLMALARKHDVQGRSTMTREQLIEAIRKSEQDDS
jgi:hypothetical protein